MLGFYIFLLIFIYKIKHNYACVPFTTIAYQTSYSSILDIAAIVIVVSSGAYVYRSSTVATTSSSARRAAL